VIFNPFGATVVSTGVYDISFTVSAVEPNQFALFVNGVVATNTIFGSGAGTQQNSGRAILQLNAGDQVTLVNYQSASAVMLQPLAGGTAQNIMASLIILKLN